MSTPWASRLSTVVAAAVAAACSGGTPATAVNPPPPAPPTDMTIFGVVHLGQPLRLQVCKSTSLAPCVAGKALDGSTQVRIPSLTATTHYDPTIDVRELDGSAELVVIRSLGRLGDDEEMRTDLTNKYGPPTAAGEHGVAARWAAWTKPDLTVNWISRSADVRYGATIIATPKGTKFFDDQMARRNATVPKL